MKEGPQTKVEEKGDYCDLQKLVKSNALSYAQTAVGERKGFVKEITKKAQEVFVELLAKGAKKEDIESAILGALPSELPFAVIDRTAQRREDVQTLAQVRMEFGIALVGILDNVVRSPMTSRGFEKEKSPESQVN